MFSNSFLLYLQEIWLLYLCAIDYIRSDSDLRHKAAKQRGTTTEGLVKG